MRELILHIGMTKTGTSALQRFFFINRRRLSEQGVCYPLFPAGPRFPEYVNGCFLGDTCFASVSGEELRGTYADPGENDKRLAEAISSHHRILISDERIIGIPYYRGKGAFVREYWDALAGKLRQQGAERVTVVVYLRRQDEWLASNWRQIIKSYSIGSSLRQWMSSPSTRARSDYASVLRTIEEAFGENARIAVRRYDRRAFHGGDIFRDFCDAAGIPWDDGLRIPGDIVNPSAGYDVTEALRALKDVPSESSLRRNVLIPLAIRLSRRNPDPPGMTPFGEAETRALMEPYLSGNEWIARRYFGGEALFSEEYGGRPVWEPNEEKIAMYRDAFERAIRQYERFGFIIDHIRPIASKLPSGIRRPLKFVESRMIR